MDLDDPSPSVLGPVAHGWLDINHGKLHIVIVRSRVENAFENIRFNPVPGFVAQSFIPSGSPLPPRFHLFSTVIGIPSAVRVLMHLTAMAASVIWVSRLRDLKLGPMMDL